MDWSTHDYTRTYADTFFLPEDTYDEGVSLLDEAAPPGQSWKRNPASAAGSDGHRRVPTRWDDDRRSRSQNDSRSQNRSDGRERYYTGGNVVSNDGERRAIYNTAWDERPMHYNPNAGTDWAHLVPPYSRRPYGGGPCPSQAFPLITNSEAQVGPKDLFTAGGGAPSRAALSTAQVVQIVLLVVLVVLMACLLNAIAGLKSDSQSWKLEKEIRDAVKDALKPPAA
jgi:hypothetical protein